MKMPLHISNFAKQYGISTELFEMFSDYFNQYRAENKLTKKNLSFTQCNSKGEAISFAEKEEKINKLILSEIGRLSGMSNIEGFAKETIVTSPMYNWASFAIVNALIDMVIPDTLIDSIGIYSNVQTVGFQDSISLNIKSNDLFAVTKAGNGGKRKTELHKQFEGQVTLVPQERDITVGVSFYRVLNGDESLAEFVMKAARSMETQMTKDAYAAFDTAMGNLPNTVGSGLRVAGFSQDAIIHLAEVVGGYNNGAKPVFVGTPIALNKILPSNTNYRIQIESDYVKTGYVQTAFGYDVLPLAQKVDYENRYNTALKDDRIYIVSPTAQKLVQVALGGATLANTTGVYDNADLSQTTTLKKKWITGIATNATAAMISL